MSSSRFFNKTVDGADGGTTGVKLSYLNPTAASIGVGRIAIVKAATSRLISGGTASVGLELLTAAGATISLNTTSNGHYPTSAAANPEMHIVLMPGDTIQWNVTTLGAGAVLDLMLSIEEKL